METRANHVVIGAFVLVVVLGLFGFVLWLAKIEIDQEFAYYHVAFDEAVSGLSLGGDVRYNGIPVGAVTAIEIARDDPSKVQVTLEVARETPVRADTVAKLELQGITGVAFIQLSGGTAAAGPPHAGPQWRIAPVAIGTLSHSGLFCRRPGTDQPGHRVGGGGDQTGE